MNSTTQSKITFIAAISNIVLLALTLAAFTLFTGYLLKQKLKADLVLEAEEIISRHLTLDETRIVFVDNDASSTIEQDLLTDRLSAQIFNKDSTPVGSFGVFARESITSQENDNIRTAAENTCVNGAQQFVHKFTLGNDSYTLLFYPLMQQQKCFGTVVIAADTHSLTELYQLALQLSIAVLAFAIVVNILAGRLTAAFILKPITALATTMKQLSIDRTPGKAPLPATPSHDPVHLLVTTFNDMAEQVHEGVQKQRGFIMNASHELKTPLARAVSTLDLAKIETNPQKLQALLEATQQELLSLSEIIEVLLQAARLKQSTLERTPIVLANLISEELKRMKADIHKKQLTVVSQVGENTVYINDQLLTLLVRNCLSNAVRYNKQRGTIKISIKEIDNSLSLNITNTIKNPSTKSGNQEEQVESHKLGAVIVKTLCELGQCTYKIKETRTSYTVTIFSLPLSIEVL